MNSDFQPSTCSVLFSKGGEIVASVPCYSIFCWGLSRLWWGRNLIEASVIRLGFGGFHTVIIVGIRVIQCWSGLDLGVCRLGVHGLVGCSNDL